MASVSSLDQDLRRMRLDKYTPQATQEVRDWIEEVLGDKLPDGDLLDTLRDGMILCRLVNKAVSPGVKAKQSRMPFVQRENISYFVRACQMPPLGLPDHDIFLTNDLYEAKDPAQVLQCIVAFSRRANAVNPSAFPRAMGAKSKAHLVSPQSSGTSQGVYTKPPTGPPFRERGLSNTSDSGVTARNPLAKGFYSGGINPSKGSAAVSPPVNVSSWSTKGAEACTAPAWDIHQYGFTGGANQGNQNISFSARRQITSPDPPLPSLVEKKRRRKEVEKEVERQRVAAEDAEQNRRQELEAQDERDQLLEEEQRWRDETRRLREVEQEEVEAEKRRWDEEQQRRKGGEEGRLREERQLEGQGPHERNRRRDILLRGQFLSQYQAEQDRASPTGPKEASGCTSEIQSTEDSGRQLELLKEPERLSHSGRRERLKNDGDFGGCVSEEQVGDSSLESGRPQMQPKTSHVDGWQDSERDYLRKEWQAHNDTRMQQQSPPPPPPHSPKSILAETTSITEVRVESDKSRPLPSPRPLPDPSGHAPNLNRTHHYLSATPGPTPVRSEAHRPADSPTTSDVERENQGGQDSQAKTRAGGLGSLFEREMEEERRRQREWEVAQKQTAKARRNNLEGIGPGQSWDIHQNGYLGRDSQNRGGPGLGVGGARRQIIGPRPPP